MGRKQKKARYVINQNLLHDLEHPESYTKEDQKKLIEFCSHPCELTGIFLDTEVDYEKMRWAVQKLKEMDNLPRLLTDEELDTQKMLLKILSEWRAQFAYMRHA